MDKDRLTGKAKDIGGRIKRQAGEWTGDEDLQAEGAADQAQGKVENTVGKVKDVGRNMLDDIRNKSKKEDVEHEEEIPRKKNVA